MEFSTPSYKKKNIKLKLSRNPVHSFQEVGNTRVIDDDIHQETQ
jgi:hypothetical protein